MIVNRRLGGLGKWRADVELRPPAAAAADCKAWMALGPGHGPHRLAPEASRRQGGVARPRIATAAPTRGLAATREGRRAKAGSIPSPPKSVDAGPVRDAVGDTLALASGRRPGSPTVPGRPGDHAVSTAEDREGAGDASRGRGRGPPPVGVDRGHRSGVEDVPTRIHGDISRDTGHLEIAASGGAIG
jgi:hypothetical protein